MPMATRFTLGIEEEFQIVDHKTNALLSGAPQLLQQEVSGLEERIKPELLQSTIELITPVLPDMATARHVLRESRALLAARMAREGQTLVSAGTHPFSHWVSQAPSVGERYTEMVAEYREAALCNLAFGLHIHVYVDDDRDLLIQVFNRARTWLPHLLALSTNAPFVEGRETGYKSYRPIIKHLLPRSAIPPTFANWQAFDAYLQELISLGVIDNGKKIWWEVRPHVFYHTLEFRVCDMPLTIQDTLALAALCQALVAKLTRDIEQGREQELCSVMALEENLWQAMRYGLDARFLDFSRRRSIPMRNAIRDLLTDLHEVSEELGCQPEVAYVYQMLDDPLGTGADRQLAIYHETGDLQEVVRFLRAQTMKDIDPVMEGMAGNSARYGGELSL